MALEIKPTLPLKGEDAAALRKEIAENESGANKIDFSAEMEWARKILANMK